MRGLIPLLQRLDQSRRVCAAYIAEGHPHLAGLTRDLPGARMAAVDTLVVAEVESAVHGLNVDAIGDAFEALYVAHQGMYRAGLADAHDVPSGLQAAASAVFWEAVYQLQDVLGLTCRVTGDESPTAAMVIDRAARIREAAADRRELAAVAGV